MQDESPSFRLSKAPDRGWCRMPEVRPSGHRTKYGEDAMSLQLTHDEMLGGGAKK